MTAIDRFVGALGADGAGWLLTSDAARAHYAQSEGHHRHPLPGIVARPPDRAAVQAIVRAAHDSRLPIVPYGAGTSLEGNAAASGDVLCLDLSALDRVIAVSVDDMTCTVEPGVTREALNTELRATGLFFPVDPGANASIGGMIATRASGTTTVRYGGMREAVMALQVVLADGSIVTTGSRARKSASGYDLTRLFTGSEGTLGVVVEATLRLHGQPEAILAATQAFPSVAAAIDTVIQTIQSGVPIARMELLDATAIAACNGFARLGLPERPTLFLEFHGSPASVAEQYETVGMLGIAMGGDPPASAATPEARAALWKARHTALYAARALRPGAITWTTDICVPIGALAEAIGAARAAIDAAGLTAPILGHVGDGNFHVIFVLDPTEADARARASAVNDGMIDRALAVGGTCTGEHGVGIGKRAAMLREHGPGAVAAMRAIKAALDPHGLMNPGKIFLD